MIARGEEGEGDVVLYFDFGCGCGCGRLHPGGDGEVEDPIAPAGEAVFSPEPGVGVAGVGVVDGFGGGEGARLVGVFVGRGEGDGGFLEAVEGAVGESFAG